MAVCPIPLPGGFSYLLSLFSFIISYSFSCFSSSGFLFHPLSSSPSLYRLVAHFGLAGASSIQQQQEEIQSSRVATAVENPLHFALSLPRFLTTIWRNKDVLLDRILIFFSSFGSIPYTFKGKKHNFLIRFPWFLSWLLWILRCFLNGILGYWVVAVSGSSVCELLPMLCSCCFVQPFLGVVPSTVVRQLTVGATTYFPVFRSLDTD